VVPATSIRRIVPGGPGPPGDPAVRSAGAERAIGASRACLPARWRRGPASTARREPRPGRRGRRLRGLDPDGLGYLTP